tara:strand:- start:1258 stop:1602 length:345 start_codon:yes stop_codon:yes gene_type:complete
MDRDDGTFDRAEFEAGFAKLDRVLRFQAIQNRYVSKEPEDDEDLLANMLAARVIAKTQMNAKVSSELEEMIRKWVHVMPPDAARRAAVTAKGRAEEWLKEIAEMEEGNSDTTSI